MSSPAHFLSHSLLLCLSNLSYNLTVSSVYFLLVVKEIFNQLHVNGEMTTQEKWLLSEGSVTPHK